MNKYPLYHIGKSLLGPIFKLYYHPQIIGKENLSIPGSKVIVGNHIHLYDQCSIIVSTKETITYLAKKEYFDSKKTRWFFQGVGCIPVDRQKKDEQASLRAIEILKEGSSIGLFPEGTRNRLKKENIKELYNLFKDKISYRTFQKKIKKNRLSQIKYLLSLDKVNNDDILNNLDNLEAYLKELLNNRVITEKEYYDSYFLDFKYGAVSMAKKTDSYIIPVVITGKYTFRSKDLMVRIGKPFKITDKDLDVANAIMRTKMLELLKLNLSSC